MEFPDEFHNYVQVIGRYFFQMIEVKYFFIQLLFKRNQFISLHPLLRLKVY